MKDVNLRRRLELEAYSAIIMAFRSQGDLSWKKENILLDLRAALKISDERHKQEIQKSEQSLGIPSSASSSSNSHAPKYFILFYFIILFSYWLIDYNFLRCFLRRKAVEGSDEEQENAEQEQPKPK